MKVSISTHRQCATLAGNAWVVPKIRRGGYVFISWKGDHPPRHVHVYRDRRLVVKWDLDNQRPMKGRAPRRVLELIEQLRGERLL